MNISMVLKCVYAENAVAVLGNHRYGYHIGVDKKILYFLASLSSKGFKVMPIGQKYEKHIAFSLIIQYNKVQKLKD